MKISYSIHIHTLYTLYGLNNENNNKKTHYKNKYSFNKTNKPKFKEQNTNKTYKQIFKTMFASNFCDRYSPLTVNVILLTQLKSNMDIS